MKNFTAWWIRWEWHYKGDIFNKIISDDNKAVENFVNTYMKVFEEYKDVVIKCNEILDNENKNK
jgi:uncharacterized protein (DUF488 family)